MTKDGVVIDENFKGGTFTNNANDTKETENDTKKDTNKDFSKAVINGINDLSSMHISGNAQGGISANAGLQGPQIPYVVIRRKESLTPSNIEWLEGLPSKHYYLIGNLPSGHYKALDMHPQNIPGATPSELSEIENTLKGGFEI